MKSSYKKIDTKIKQQTATLYRRPAYYEAPANPVGLSRTHRIMSAQISNETQFLLICSQIRLTDYKQTRAEGQRNERKAKR
jgi:hypothetical protein